MPCCTVPRPPTAGRPAGWHPFLHDWECFLVSNGNRSGDTTLPGPRPRRRSQPQNAGLERGVAWRQRAGRGGVVCCTRADDALLRGGSRADTLTGTIWRAVVPLVGPPWLLHMAREERCAHHPCCAPHGVRTPLRTALSPPPLALVATQRVCVSSTLLPAHPRPIPWDPFPLG